MYSTFFYPQTTIKWWVNCSYTYCHWKLEMKKKSHNFFHPLLNITKMTLSSRIVSKNISSGYICVTNLCWCCSNIPVAPSAEKIVIIIIIIIVITTIMIINVSIIITIIIVSCSRTWGNTQWKTDCPRYVAPLLSLSEYNVISFKMDILKTYLNSFFGIETKYGVSMQCWNI